MAHQCLQCGETFPDGSPQLLKGCPPCGGTRFFYTQSPLARQERERLMAEANRDLRAILRELVDGQAAAPRPDYDDPLWSQEARRRWLEVDARKLRGHHPGAVREVPPPAREEPAPPPPPAHGPRPRSVRAPSEQVPLSLVEERPAPTSATPALDDSEPRERRPEVVVVHEPGTYEVDVEQLLDRSPVVVRRDGVYVVHLPSVFQGPGPKR